MNEELSYLVQFSYVYRQLGHHGVSSVVKPPVMPVVVLFEPSNVGPPAMSNVWFLSLMDLAGLCYAADNQILSNN